MSRQTPAELDQIINNTDKEPPAQTTMSREAVTAYRERVDNLLKSLSPTETKALAGAGGPENFLKALFTLSPAKLMEALSLSSSKKAPQEPTPIAQLTPAAPPKPFQLG